MRCHCEVRSLGAAHPATATNTKTNKKDRIRLSRTPNIYQKKKIPKKRTVRWARISLSNLERATCSVLLAADSRSNRARSSNIRMYAGTVSEGLGGPLDRSDRAE